MSPYLYSDLTFNLSAIMREAHRRFREVGSRSLARIKGFGFYLAKAWGCAKMARFNNTPEALARRAAAEAEHVAYMARPMSADHAAWIAYQCSTDGRLPALAA